MSRKPHGIACPHCGLATGIRHSRSMTPLVRQMQLQCVNAQCGATFGADLTITHQISPSAMPNAAIMLRTTPPRKVANDDFPPAANDQSGPEVPRAANDDQAVGVETG